MDIILKRKVRWLPQTETFIWIGFLVACVYVWNLNSYKKQYSNKLVYGRHTPINCQHVLLHSLRQYESKMGHKFY